MSEAWARCDSRAALKATTTPVRGATQLTTWVGCMVVTAGVIWVVHPHALLGYAHYFLLWSLFIALFDHVETRHFVNAYFVNAALTALYVLVQVHFYPDSHGCTSPLGAQTDDSFFFSLVADEIPLGMDTRPEYYLYSYGFSNLVRAVTPFTVTHPLDILFFLSGVAALVSVYTRRLAVHLTGSERAGRMAYFLALFCPMMLMNGGAVFVRDTFVGALLVLSFCCFYRRRYVAFALCVISQFFLRPGTALMILVLYAAVFVTGRKWKPRSQFQLVVLACTITGLVFGGLALGYSKRDWLKYQLEKNGVVLGEFRREGQDETLAGGFGKGSFTAIQRQVLPLRLSLSTVYMYLAPFFNTNNLRTSDGFDTRILLMNVVYPLWVWPVHAGIFAAFFAPPRVRATLRQWMWVLLFACFLIGSFSLQSRHRVVIQPLFYALSAAGFYWGSTWAKKVGFALAGIWVAAQMAYLWLF
jgi:hypothetical protein